MKVIIISINKWALPYLRDSFNDRQLENVTLVTDKLSKELKDFLEIKNIKYLVAKSLVSLNLKKLDIKNSIILSAAPPWIFNEKIIKKFGKNFYNVHQGPLPSMKGSIAPYMIMYDIRASQVCLHQVTSGIDSGKIIFKKNVFIPSSIKTPLDVNNFLQSKNREMVKEFLIKLEKKTKFNLEKQNSFFSSYNIRLLSEINGWIDWNYKLDDLDRFIRSFGDPYTGAKTFINNKQVNIKYVEKSKEDAARHPDEVGRVIRRFEDYIVISVNEGSLYVKELFWKRTNIISKIKSGDKFYTKIKYLDLKNRRVNFINKDNRIYNKKTKLIKL